MSKLQARQGLAGSCPPETIFRPDDIDFGLRRNRPATQGLHSGHAVNNGVDSMTFILRFIYREYCRSCFLHIRYL